MSIAARCWTALALPPLAWFAFEQGLSAVLHADCTLWWIALCWGAASLALCALSAALVWRFKDREGPLVHIWLARLSLGVAILFGLAIVYQSLAILIVPACLA